MLTRCSQCQAWFRVRAEHLSAAGGFVTCGQCEAVFNALETLVEERAAPPRLDTATSLPPTAPVASEPSPVPDPIAGQDLDQEHADASIDPGDTPPMPEAPPIAPPYTAPVTYQAPPSAPPVAPSQADVFAPSVPATESVASAARSAAIDDALNEVSRPQPAPETHPAALPPTAPAPDAEEPQPAKESQPAEELHAAEELHPSEEPQAAEAIASPDANATPGYPETPPAHAAASAAATTVTTASEVDVLYGPPTLPPGEAPLADAGMTLSAEDHAILFTAPGSDEDDEEDDDQRQVLGSTPPRAREDQDDGDDDKTEPHLAADGTAVPPLLLDELAALEGANRRGRLAGMWRVLVVLFTLLLLAQGAYKFREQLVRQWPASAALFARVCAALECRDRTAANSGIRMLARDVREHPQYRDALLVNATMVNVGDEHAPFPVIELRVHDGVGRLIGARRFAPEEYLDDSIPIDDGMLTDQPVYVVLEVGGDAARATSFEFNFL